MTLEEIIKKLPHHIQEVLQSPEHFKLFESITRSYDLNIEESGRLMEEFIYVVAGLTHPDNFVDEIQKALSIPREKALEITKDIDDMILKPIKKDLVELYNGEGKNLEEKGYNTAPTGEEERDALLKEIENPSPLKNTPSPQKKESVEERPRDETTSYDTLLEEIETPHKTPSRQDVVAQKLSSPVKIEKVEKKKDEAESSLKQPIDPYREPVD